MNDATAWIALIRRARSDEEVVRIVREYLAAFAPTRAFGVCDRNPGRELCDRIGICEAAVDVARAELSFAGDPQSHRQLKELATVLVAASERFVQLET